MANKDEMLQIDLCNGQVRVMLCETTETVQRCADIHSSTPVCTAALGRLMTGTAMLGIMMKGEDENVTVTIKGDGPMGSLVAVADHGKIRACADNPQVELPLREDGKLDLSPRRKAFLQMEDDAALLLDRLEKAGGVLPYGDGSSPEELKKAFGLSKNAFKRAAGRLLREGRIAVTDKEIRVTRQ